MPFSSAGGYSRPKTFVNGGTLLPADLNTVQDYLGGAIQETLPSGRLQSFVSASVGGADDQQLYPSSTSTRGGMTATSNGLQAPVNGMYRASSWIAFPSSVNAGQSEMYIRHSVTTNVWAGDRASLVGPVVLKASVLIPLNAGEGVYVTRFQTSIALVSLGQIGGIYAVLELEWVGQL